MHWGGAQGMGVARGDERDLRKVSRGEVAWAWHTLAGLVGQERIALLAEIC